MDMNQPLIAVFLSTLLLAIICILPLAPAVLIYKLFPDTIVRTEGPFSGLKLNATGAFGAYIIIFIALTPFAYRCQNLISNLSSPSWTIVGSIQLKDSSGKISKAPNGKSVQVTLTPDLIEVTQDQFRLRVPEIENRIPNLTFSVGDLGAEVVNFDALGDTSISKYPDRRLIKIDTPVIIRLISANTNYTPNGTLTPLPESSSYKVLDSKLDLGAEK